MNPEFPSSHEQQHQFLLSEKKHSKIHRQILRYAPEYRLKSESKTLKFKNKLTNEAIIASQLIFDQSQRIFKFSKKDEKPAITLRHQRHTSGISPKTKKLRQINASNQNEQLINNYVKNDQTNQNVNPRESLLHLKDSYSLTNEYPAFLLSFGIQ